MELDLQSLLGSRVRLYPLSEAQQLPLPPHFGLIYEDAIGQLHLFVTHWFNSFL